MSHEHRKHLVAGLVGDRWEMYQTSATFYHNVHALADLLPMWMDGIAARAEELDAEFEAMKRTVKELDLHAAGEGGRHE